jgi:hypothetical protein
MFKKSLLLIPICTLSLFMVIAQSMDCTKFRNGTFKMVNDGTTTIIERNGNKQLEFYNGSKAPTSLIVNWVDDCTYTLKPTEETLKKLPGIPKEALLTVKIIKVSNNTYIQTSTSNFSELVLTSEVIKIK